MSDDQVLQLRLLEGHRVCVALRNGTRIDDCQLVAFGRPTLTTVWIYSNGSDSFVDLGDIVEVWETAPVRGGVGAARR